MTTQYTSIYTLYRDTDTRHCRQRTRTVAVTPVCTCTAPLCLVVASRGRSGVGGRGSLRSARARSVRHGRHVEHSSVASSLPALWVAPVLSHMHGLGSSTPALCADCTGESALAGGAAPYSTATSRVGGASASPAVPHHPTPSLLACGASAGAAQGACAPRRVPTSHGLVTWAGHVGTSHGQVTLARDVGTSIGQVTWAASEASNPRHMASSHGQVTWAASSHGRPRKRPRLLLLLLLRVVVLRVLHHHHLQDNKGWG